ncbi:polyprenyl synthetase family protein [Amycolatopsis sp. NPDC059657]|uniref:polyprenyl synthetase family protein n=1 Tax=Amycolatopsis sp. NPDC059657 TaxID=3346899 RepID=UPI003670F7A2
MTDLRHGTIAVLTTAHAIFERTRVTVAPRLKSTVDKLPGGVRDIAGYHFGWCDEHGAPVAATPGKMLRPALTLLCAEAVGAHATQAIEPAVAVELVHNFSLLHDDVMDGDALRRSRPTVWSVFGVPMAILAGDALVVLAMEVLADSPSSAGKLSVAMRELIEGQFLDLSFERHTTAGLDDCLAMAGGKTAALLRCASELGAAHGGGSPSAVNALGRFGWHLGLAFQLVDDLLGIWGDPAVTGKPALSDLLAGKKTLPVAAALAAGGRGAERLVELASAPRETRDVVAMAALIERLGGRSWAHSVAEAQVNTALSCLDETGVAPAARTDLLALATLVTERDR